MCSNPITIRNPKSILTRTVNMPNGYVYRGDYASLVVPCGKCMSCLLCKQLSRVPQFYTAVSSCPSCMVTLTYRNDTVPLMHTLELSEDDRLQSFVPEEQRGSLFSMYGLSMHGSLSPKSLGCSTVAPSLRREDVRLYIKRERLKFQRLDKEKKFKFTLCGEYGSRTHRPHYHLLVSGLDYSSCNEFFNDWRSEFGNVCIKQIERFYRSSHGVVKDGFIASSRYVAKYMHKGIFEDKYVTSGYVEKPRNVSSRFFGVLDIDGNPLFSDSFLSVFGSATLEDSDRIASFVSNFSISGFGFPLPRTWIRYLFYHVYKDYVYDSQSKCNEVKYRYVPSSVWFKVQDILSSKRLELLEEQQKQFALNSGIEDSVLLASSYSSVRNSLRESKEKYLYDTARRFYAESKF